jgi:hypothetical protein
VSLQPWSGGRKAGVATYIVMVECKSLKERTKFVNGASEHSVNTAPSN